MLRSPVPRHGCGLLLWFSGHRGRRSGDPEAESGSHNVGIPARLTLHALATVRIHAQGAADYQQLSDGSLRSSIKSREQTSPSWGKQVLGVGAGHHTDRGEVSRGLGAGHHTDCVEVNRSSGGCWASYRLWRNKQGFKGVGLGIIQTAKVSRGSGCGNGPFSARLLTCCC